MPDTVDVVVVGAGLSGLQAAHDVHKAGLSVLVLEAKDRVGGKTWSRTTTTGGTVDMGAAWINDTNQSKMFALSQRFDLETIQQRAQGNDLHQLPDGSIKIVPFGASRFSPETDQVILDFMKQIDSKGRELDMRDPKNYEKYKDLDTITLAEYCERYAPGEIPIAVADRCARAWLGATVHEMSALFFIDYVRSGRGFAVMRSDTKDGGQYLRLRAGTQTFSHALASTLPPGSLLLSHPVTSITQTAPSPSTSTSSGHHYCTVTSAPRSFSIRCRRVIISTPTPLYRHITFTPPLPRSKTATTSHTTLGYYAKTLLIYASPWWRALNLSGVSNSLTGPVGFTRDTCSADQSSLTCFIVAGRGRTWSRLDARERRRQVLAQIANMFGAAAAAPQQGGGGQPSAEIPEPVQVLEQEWVKEEWIEGAPSPVMALGALSEGGLVRITEPFMNVHFVGTETADVWRGYMEGAVRSGERGAGEVIKTIGLTPRHDG